MLRDTNKWVRISAYKALGHFLHLLKGLKINARLVGEYLKMADNDINSLGKDNEIVYSCAYNLPAVLDALGAAHWESELWKLYEKLLKCTDKVLVSLTQRVKQTMS